MQAQHVASIAHACAQNCQFCTTCAKFCQNKMHLHATNQPALNTFSTHELPVLQRQLPCCHFAQRNTPQAQATFEFLPPRGGFFCNCAQFPHSNAGANAVAHTNAICATRGADLHNYATTRILQLHYQYNFCNKKNLVGEPTRFCVLCLPRAINYLGLLIAACAAAKRAIGTRYGEQET